MQQRCCYLTGSAAILIDILDAHPTLIQNVTDNKKAQHPVGLFYIFDAFGITPVVPASLLFLLLFLSGASCSLCPHDKK